jgi:hypothetical protein
MDAIIRKKKVYLIIRSKIQMIRIFFQLFIILLLSFNSFSQTDETRSNNKLTKSDTTVSYIAISHAEIEKYVQALKKDTGYIILGGYVTSIYHEPIDKALICIQVEGKIIDSLITSVGLFRTSISSEYFGKRLKLMVRNSEFHDYDTSFVWNNKITVVDYINLIPRIKILLRGRVYGGSLPLSGVNVDIWHNKEELKTVTLDCYTDNEKYWNCLFLGMFKQELVADNPLDSIYLTFEKDGMKPMRLGMTIGDYSGEILDLKMKYASKLTRCYLNDINLNFGFPYTTGLGDWFVGLS